jgi:predicted O-methyltransferase YrrM
MTKIFDILNSFYEKNNDISFKFFNEISPEISINNYVANFLFSIIKSNNFIKCLDIGTLNGKSAMTMAKAVLENIESLEKKNIFLDKTECKIITIENNQENFINANKNFKLNNFDKIIKSYFSDAKELLNSYEFQNLLFDLIFIDANKAAYDIYFEFAKKNINKGGYIIFDNIFLHKIKEYEKQSKIFQTLEYILEETLNKNIYSSIIVPYEREKSSDAFLLVKIL